MFLKGIFLIIYFEVLLFCRHFFSVVDWSKSHEDVVANNLVFDITCKYKIRLTKYLSDITQFHVDLEIFPLMEKNPKVMA